ncbi:MAG TPA: hypothetical protein VK797_22920 [Tepidisphaeraceae bacterium]|nr:hypothetical protein [Tepidisphaeraceae bacterium]
MNQILNDVWVAEFDDRLDTDVHKLFRDGDYVGLVYSDEFGRGWKVLLGEERRPISYPPSSLEEMKSLLSKARRETKWVLQP